VPDPALVERYDALARVVYRHASANTRSASG
jgi:hypothetical protein